MGCSSRVPALALSLALAGCNARSGSTLAPPSQTAPVPADAQLLLCSGGWSARAGAPREVFAVRADGGGLTRLTFCNGEEQACDNVAVAAAASRARLAVVRIAADSNQDGRFAPPDDAGLVVIDLARKLEAPAVPAAEKVRSVDWSPTEDLLVYGGASTVSPADEDLFRSGLSGKDRTTLVATTDRDRSLRIDPSGQVGVFERLDSQGRGSLWGLTNAPVAVTPGPTAGGPLPGSDYAPGSDSTPAFSPDGGQIVFRRLTGKSGALETWDLVVRDLETDSETVIVTGPAFRDAPDWSSLGIAFAEIDGTGSRLVVVAPDGTSRRVPVTLPAGSSLSSVRWLAPPATR